MHTSVLINNNMGKSNVVYRWDEITSFTWAIGREFSSSE